MVSVGSMVAMGVLVCVGINVAVGVMVGTIKFKCIRFSASVPIVLSTTILNVMRVESTPYKSKETSLFGCSKGSVPFTSVIQLVGLFPIYVVGLSFFIEK